MRSRVGPGGYSHCFCTPHIWPNLPTNTIANSVRWTDELQQKLDEAQIPLRLMPGGELNLRPELAEESPADVVTYGMQRRHVLVDLWADELPSHFERDIRWLQWLGLTVILAHPERMRAVQSEPTLAGRFRQLGLLLQGNLQCFGDPPDSPTYRTAERFLKEGQYTFLAFDLHRPDTLDRRLRGLERVIQLIGESAADRLLKDNPRGLLATDR